MMVNIDVSGAGVLVGHLVLFVAGGGINWVYAECFCLVDMVAMVRWCGMIWLMLMVVLMMVVVWHGMVDVGVC